MFMKKKKTVQPTYYDNQLKSLIEDWMAARDHLISSVERCITRKGVIDLYPDGADKKLAQADLETAQRILLNRIAAYDLLRTKISQFPTDKCKVMHYNANGLAKSHEIVEIAYRNYFRKD